MGGEGPDARQIAPPPVVDEATREALASAAPAAPAPSNPAPQFRVRHKSRVEEAPPPPPELDPAAGPHIHAISPSEGPVSGGITITVTGYFFAPNVELVIAGKSVAVVYEGDARLSFKLPAHAPAGKVDLRVTNPDGKYQDRIWGFEYLGPCLVARVEPSSAPVPGGPLLQIHGAGFRSGCLVQIGASSAQTRFISSELVEIIAQPHPAGRFDVTVWNPDGQSGCLPGGFEYASPPVIERVEPSTGPSGAQQEICVHGRHFDPRTTAALFEQIGLHVRFESSELLRLLLPARSSGPVDLTLYNPDGQRTRLPQAFVYDAAPPPSLTGLTPGRVPCGVAGTQASVAGAGLQAGAALFIGQFPLQVVSVQPELAQVVLPAFPAAGRADLRVQNPDGQWAILPQAVEVFDETQEAARTAARVLCITSVEPAAGPFTGGTRVQIRGVGFSRDTRVLIGGSRPASAHFVDDSLIEVVTDDAVPGRVDIELRDEGALGCLAPAGFTYEAIEPARIDHVTPNRGSVSGGHRLTITGEHFLPDTRARLGNSAVELRFVSPTELELVTPAAAPGLADLVLIQPDGERTLKPRIYLYE